MTHRFSAHEHVCRHCGMTRERAVETGARCGEDEKSAIKRTKMERKIWQAGLRALGVQRGGE